MNGQELEQQVKEILNKNGWQVLSGAFYTDPSTQKPREKDIIATKPQNVYQYNVTLFIECKLIEKQTTIYFKGTISEINNTLIAYNIPYAKISEIECRQKTHFYKKYDELFDSAKDSENVLYKAINQNLQSYQAYRKNNWQCRVDYLIVVYSGEIFCLNQVGGTEKRENALLKVDTIDDTFDLPNKGCLIEIVSISQFENLLKDIQEDINTLNGSMNFYRRRNNNQSD